MRSAFVDGPEEAGVHSPAEVAAFRWLLGSAFIVVQKEIQIHSLRSLLANRRIWTEIRCPPQNSK